MPIVEVKMLEGRDQAIKQRLIREITDTVERCVGVPRQAVRVLIHEIPPVHWGTAGEPKSR